MGRGGKVRVSCSLDKELLEAVDRSAEAAGESRSAAVGRLLAEGLSPGERTGVFVEMNGYMMGRMRAWAERTGADDLAKMLFDGFVDGIDATAFVKTALEPADRGRIAEAMGRPGAPTEGIRSLWLDPETEGTFHPRLVYEPAGPAPYRTGALMDWLGMSGMAVSSRACDPEAMGYAEVWRERG